MTFEKWLPKVTAKGLSECWEYLFVSIEGYDKHHEMRHKRCGIISKTKTPRSHLNQDDPTTLSQGCTTCYRNSKRKHKSEIVQLGQLRFGDHFNYERLPEIISNNRTKIIIICKDHGEFKTTYSTHLNGEGGCIPCSNNMKTKKEIIECYSEAIYDNGVMLLLDEFDDNDIIKSTTPLKCKCIINESHDTWFAVIGNLTRRNTGCPNKECINPKIEKTMLELHGVKNGFQTKQCREAMIISMSENKEEIGEKRRTTMLERFQVEHALQSQELQSKMQKSAFTYKDYKTPSGEIRRIQGYENKALDELFPVYDETDIMTDRSDIPIIGWKDGEKSRKYYPDIFVKSRNLIIEVKSTQTFEWHKREVLMKARATRESGFDIEIWIYDKKNKHILIDFGEST